MALAQTPCPGVHFLNAITVNLKPTDTSHIDVVRQSDGSYTGFEVSDAAPFRTIATIPHFEKQFAACLPHTIPASPTAPAPVANPIGAGSQAQVSMTLSSGSQFVANISLDGLTIYFDVFDSAHTIISQASLAPPSLLYPGVTSLALADVNRDGNLDLIAVFADGVWVFPGNGDGTFQPGRSSALPGTSSVPSSFVVAIGDLNGDGIPDLVLSGTGCCGTDLPAPITIALGKGDGTFTERGSFSVPALSSILTSAAIADLNGDGKADLVLSGGIVAAMALGNGDGTFQAITSYSVLDTTYGISLASVAVGDVNGDGIPDIVTLGSILFGDGKGGFPSRRDYVIPNASGSVMLADFDGDGITDIIIGNGNPDFLSGSALNAAATSSALSFSLCDVGAPQPEECVADLTGPSLTVLFGAGGGTFTAAPVSEVAANYLSLAAADFNGDGLPDLAVTSAGSVSILKGNGDGGFSSVFTQSTPGAGTAAVAAADFNHDGKPDVAVLLYLAATSEVEVYPGNGDLTLGAPVPVPIPDATANFIATPDLNGDGIPDLVVTSASSVFVSLSKGDGTFSAPLLVASGNNPAVAFGDFNGDGKLDIAITNFESTDVIVLLGKGDGTFPNSVPTALPASAFPHSAGGGPGTMTAADFNGDGKLDLAVVGAGVSVFFGRGDGGFSGYQSSPVYGSTIFTADMNGDGLADLITSGPLSVALGNGDGTFQTSVELIPYPTSGSLAIADFNRDGMPDIAATLDYFGVAAFLNLSRPSQPLTVVSAASFAIGPLAPDSFAAAFGQGMTGSAQPVAIGSLAGFTVSVEDSAGTSRTATLYFVSDNQVNFLVPANTATGPATVTVTTVSGKKLTAQLQIAAIAPALFVEGSDIAAAYAVYAAPSGAQTIEPVLAAQYGSILTVPLDVSQPGETFLILFGTGFDAASAATTVATVQGVSVPVSYAGVQPTDAGLDQINLLLPPSLAGAGDVSVAISIAGQATNTVLVTIQ
jgi:uncharacterized protein (TIGR03437 family)